MGTRRAAARLGAARGCARHPLLCTLTVRSITEPKLVAAQAGLPPIASLMAMYLGARAFGVAGMVLFPLLLLLAAQMLRTKKEGSL